MLSMMVAGAAIDADGAAAWQELPAPVGDYAVTIALEDVPRDFPAGATLIGRWRIGFGADGAYELERQDVGVVARGRAAVAGDRLTVTDESGPLACPAGADGSPAPGVYAWDLIDGRLRLAAIEEPCAERRLLFTTRLLTRYVACPPLPDGAAASPVGVGAGTPVAITATPGAAGAAAGAAIDDLLATMSACWATRQPERFRPLLSPEQAAALIGDGEDAARRFARTMAAPIVWERSGEVELLDATHAAATVRLFLGDEVDYLRFAFVADAAGAWRWDGVYEDAA